jgi:hypothetical protein
VNLRTWRGLVALFAVVVATGIAGACGSTLQNAATVRFPGDSPLTVDIDRSEFEDDLRDVTEAQKIIQDAQAEAGGEGDADDSPDTDDSKVDAELAANWLQTRIYAAAFQQMFDARDLEITSDVHDAAVASTHESYGGQETFEQFPQSLQDELIRQQELIEAIAADEQANAEPAVAPTEEDARAYYEANKDALSACASGKHVAHILVEDEATAQQLLGQLQSGAAFADLAAANSTDDGSGEQGGQLGCLEPATFAPEFQQAADAAPLGEVVGPVQTEFGYHLILVTPFTATYEELRPQILTQLQAEAEQQAGGDLNAELVGELNETLEGADVTVDPRFGTWDFDDQNEQWRVQPPESPSPREQREPDSTTVPETVPGLPGG